MSEKEILDGVTNILIDEFEIPLEKIHPDVAIYEELELDSLDSVDLTVALEKKFGFKVNREKDEELLRNMRKVSDICKYIMGKQ